MRTDLLTCDRCENESASTSSELLKDAFATTFICVHTIIIILGLYTCSATEVPYIQEVRCIDRMRVSIGND